MTSGFGRPFGLMALGFFLSGLAWSAEKHVVVVEKKTNTLRLAKYDGGSLKTVKQFHATIGKVQGDKEAEGDLKTPEGIYFVDGKQTAPKIAFKLGVRSFHLNYPNAFDLLAGRSGSNIMLHATNEPDRLKKDFDSEGCVVVRNEEILEIEPYVRVGLTPVLIFSELSDINLNPGTNSSLKAFFDGWVSAWENKDAVKYIDHYHTDFIFKDRANMNRDQFLKYKEGLNKIYQKIEVKPEDVMMFTHPKYSVVVFTQNYRSTLKSGGSGHVSRGTKVLYIAEEAGKPKIVAESFSRQTW